MPGTPAPSYTFSCCVSRCYFRSLYYDRTQASAIHRPHQKLLLPRAPLLLPESSAMLPSPSGGRRALRDSLGAPTPGGSQSAVGLPGPCSPPNEPFAGATWDFGAFKAMAAEGSNALYPQRCLLQKRPMGKQTQSVWGCQLSWSLDKATISVAPSDAECGRGLRQAEFAGCVAYTFTK